MSLALYRKYRPSTFVDVIGQEHVTTPLSNALISGQIHHAYLFSGPRGCGKTSSARIMARSLNCEKGPTPNPCGTCQSCKDLVANGPGSLDVIELDAATHGLVDDARDLRDKAFFAPVQSRYKIYIIDEAHQLGPGAANALLKVVEEPPAHVLFIFATTEPEKLISTIRSRTHHYPFRLVPPAILSTHLEKVCESEGIKVAKGVIQLVVRASGGSVRDAQSILGQLLAGAGSEGVTYEIAVALLGYTDSALLDEAIDSLAASDSASLFNTVDRVVESGQDPKRFAQDLLERLRDLIIVGAVDENNSQVLVQIPMDQLDRMRTQAKLIGIANLIRSADLLANGLTQMRGATPPRLILELVCGQMMLPQANDAAVSARLEKLERGVISAAPTVEVKAATSEPVQNILRAEPKIEVKPVVAVKTEPVKVESKPTNHKPSGVADIATLRRLWPQVIENVKGKRRLTWSLLATSAQILSVDDESISIGIVNAGARDSFVRSESDVILSDAFEEVAGVRRKIVATVDTSVATTTMARSDEDPSDANMLTGADLLASKLGAKVIKESD
ncbi:DNA polymerase III subunit gamma/tau [Candidatus Nanopelagicus hibericus]|uniref:DNA polymerase III subunit gamma/tau n=1 Tax=Candidatus Nanopelagicus hibericus TaxID=1884915 RepID=A0A249KAL6_9ACTN|nr:DNA polymerase III subunit gamma and tau [Candidatus Nanopelagicus hibericus]ASY13827.1 DNA polymerase III subunit gamma/tau [Candidatus Nanopelagicus hibericus]